MLAWAVSGDDFWSVNNAWRKMEIKPETWKHLKQESTLITYYQCHHRVRKWSVMLPSHRLRRRVSPHRHRSRARIFFLFQRIQRIWWSSIHIHCCRVSRRSPPRTRSPVSSLIRPRHRIHTPSWALWRHMLHRRSQPAANYCNCSIISLRFGVTRCLLLSTRLRWTSDPLRSNSWSTTQLSSSYRTWGVIKQCTRLKCNSSSSSSHLTRNSCSIIFHCRRSASNRRSSSGRFRHLWWV